MGRFLGITVKRVAPCPRLDGHVKEPYEMSMAWESDRRYNFFFSPPAHLCAVTYITEKALHVMLSNYSLSHIVQIIDFLDFLHENSKEKFETFTEF